jgi:hypothetical protein
MVSTYKSTRCYDRKSNIDRTSQHLLLWRVVCPAVKSVNNGKPFWSRIQSASYSKIVSNNLTHENEMGDEFNTLKPNSNSQYLNIQSVPQRKHISPLQRKHVNAVKGNEPCLQWESQESHKYEMQLLIVKAGGIYSWRWALKGQRKITSNVYRSYNLVPYCDSWNLANKDSFCYNREYTQPDRRQNMCRLLVTFLPNFSWMTIVCDPLTDMLTHACVRADYYYKHLFTLVLGSSDFSDYNYKKYTDVKQLTLWCRTNQPKS